MQHRERIRLIDGFRSYAAALVVEQGQQMGEVARRFGVDTRLLSRWIGAFCTGDKSVADELGALRREIASLRSERDALFTALSLSLSREAGNTPLEHISSPRNTHGNSKALDQTVTDPHKGRPT